MVANTIVFFGKFSQKDKLLWIHIIFFLLVLVSGCITLTDYDYQNYMDTLVGKNVSDAACTSSGYVNECSIVSQFRDYHY